MWYLTRRGSHLKNCERVWEYSRAKYIIHYIFSSAADFQSADYMSHPQRYATCAAPQMRKPRCASAPVTRQIAIGTSDVLLSIRLTPAVHADLDDDPDDQAGDDDLRHDVLRTAEDARLLLLTFGIAHVVPPVFGVPAAV